MAQTMISLANAPMLCLSDTLEKINVFSIYNER